MILKRLSGMVMGVLAAMVGFSYALATSQGNADTNSAVVALPRLVGSGLTYSNPLLLAGQAPTFPTGGATAADPNGFDLGDACYGSTIVRYLTGLNGVKPYSFSSTTITTTGLNLGETGRVFGAIPVAAGSSALFNATLTDAAGATRMGTFRLGTFVCPPGTFRFAHDRLSGAQVGMDYITNIETLGGDATTTFSVVPNSVAFNGVALTDMESIGIRLFEDGTIAGRPIRNGTLTFTARAVRGTGQIALNRTNSAPDQALTINIAALNTIQSVLGTISTTITGSTIRPGRDVFSYNAVLNTNGLSPFNFAGLPFTIRFGGKTFTTTLDGRGQSRFGDVRVALSGPEGLLRVSLRNQNFSTIFGSLADQSKKVVVVEIQIGDKFLGTEPLYYSVVNRRGRYRLIYGLYRSRQIGGLFQITKIAGDDSDTGTAFQTQFLISQVPDSQSESLGFITGATINIGQGFTQDVPINNNRGFFNPPGIATVRFQTPRRTGQIFTYHLPSSQTGVALSKNSGGIPQTFLLGLQLRTNTLTLNGEASQRLFPFSRRF